MKISNSLSQLLKASSIILVLLQFSCAQNKQRETIVVASAGKIESLDPAQANTLRTLQLLSSLGDTLYKINKKGELYPVLAKDLPKVSKDRLTIDISLKEDITFHDGSQFNANAMAFSLRRFIEIGTLNYLLKDKLEDIEVLEDFVLRLKLKKPSSSIKGLLTSVNLTPVSPKSYSQHRDKFNNENFIGTGPYFLKSFSSGQQRIQPYMKYWDKKPLNKGIDYINFNNSSTLFGAIKSKEVDVLISNSIDDMQRIYLSNMVKKGKLKEGKGEAIEIGFITLKSNKLPLSNKKIRQAISYSIDRKLISQQVSFGTRDPLRSIIPPHFHQKSIQPWPSYNPETTRKLLKEEGFCNSKVLTIPLTFRSNVPADRLFALTWKDQIKRDLSDCMNITLNGLESTTVYKQLAEGSFEAIILDWTGDYPDPESYLTPLLSCNLIKQEDICIEGEAVSSGSFWANEKVQSLLKRSEEIDGEKRLNTLIKVQELAAEGAAYIPVWIVKPKAWSLQNISQPEFSRDGMIILQRLKRD